MAHVPTAVRTCVACREKRSRQELVRFVADERGHLRPDPGQRLAGRGVYTCAARRCVERAAERGWFARGLRRRVAKVDGVELTRRTARCVDDERRGLLILGRQDGRVVRSSGTEGEAAAPLGTDGSGWIPRDPRLARRVTMLAEQVLRLEA